MKTITTSQSSFELLMDGETLYVDKTMYAYRLARNRNRNFYFLSRPRRFGKSLFCSTLHSLFEGRKELFKGLYIERETDYDFQPYPVIHFDFSSFDFTDDGTSFLRAFNFAIWYEGKRNGIELEKKKPAEMLEDLIIKLSDEKGKVVILIDEFDSPFTSMIGQSKLVELVRNTFNSFYKVIKKHSTRIRFFFITGVVKLANLSIFSAMNNLIDISMDPGFAAICGYTEDELDEYFGEGIDEYAEENNADRDMLRKQIRDYYDGYRFSPDSEEKVYNPVSIGYFFNSSCRFRNYWDMTGVPTFAVELAKKCNFLSLISEGITIDSMTFTSFDISLIAAGSMNKEYVAALLYYGGYLTTEEWNGFAITLGFPNMDVASSFSRNLVSRYAEKDYSMGIWLSSFIKACTYGEEEEVRKKIEEYFAAFSYELQDMGKERFYQTIFHAIFICAGLYAVSEDRGARGRADEVIISGNHIWIFELKVDRSAEEALGQIEKKGYAEKYSYLLKPGMKIHKVGISFSSETRIIQEWRSIEECK